MCFQESLLPCSSHINPLKESTSHFFLSILLKLSFITFCVMFICVVIFIKKYAKRVDIEYGRHGAEISKENGKQNLNDNYFNESYDSDKRTIDKRLILIQEEENAPSESKVLPQDRDKNEVMNLEHFEKLKSNLDEL